MLCDVQNLVVAGVRTICAEILREETLRDSIIKQLDIKDSMKGTVSLSGVMPLLMVAFQRKFALAQLHQDALMKAVDTDRDGLIDWEGFSAAALLIQQSLSGMYKDESDALHAFHAACKLSKKHNCCSAEHAAMKLRAHLWRLWSLESSLPAVGMTLNEDGVPMLPATYAETMQEQLETLKHEVERTAQVRDNCCCHTHQVKYVSNMECMLVDVQGLDTCCSATPMCCLRASTFLAG
jgi:hypothetical protein